MKLTMTLPRDLDIADVATWPRALKGAGCICLATLVLAAGHLLVLADSGRELAAAERQQDRLRTETATKKQLAAHRTAAETQRQRAATALGQLLARLPSDTEVPGLIEDISRAAVANGLTIDGLTLGEEAQADLYLELPIAIAARGRYHQFGRFAAAIAALPRLVTLHDFDINADDDKEDLTMTIVAKTYRYTDTDPDQWLESEPEHGRTP